MIDINVMYFFLYNCVFVFFYGVVRCDQWKAVYIVRVSAVVPRRIFWGRSADLWTFADLTWHAFGLVLFKKSHGCYAAC